VKRLLFEIKHTTTYEYMGGVSVSHHLLRLKPRDSSRQRCRAHQLIIDPQPATISFHRDYFGNRAHFVDVASAHKQFVVTSLSQVAISPVFLPEPSETPAWESVRARCRDDHAGPALEAHEFAYSSPLVPAFDSFAEYARPSFEPRRPILDVVGDLTRRIAEDFTFDPVATTVTTPLEEVMRLRRGVCQDLAHVQIACLRSHGVPARYVSGYIETEPPPGQPKLRGVDASHAWVSFFCPGLGWIDADPTNNCFPSLRHITIGWGRDYNDVCPIRGVLIGGQNQSLRVAVDVNAIGPVEATATD
jgi:transglutaminase-like putative cysteine protease